MIEVLEQFYSSKSEPYKSCLYALRDIILSSDPQFTECSKYRMPCFCIGKKAVCYLWTDKETDEPYILFVEEGQMEHPKLEQGNRARMKILRVDPNKDFPLETIREIIKKALSFL